MVCWTLHVYMHCYPLEIYLHHKCTYDSLKCCLQSFCNRATFDMFFLMGVFFCWICVWDQSISLFFGVWKVHMQISTPFYFPLFPLSALRPWVFMRWRAMERRVGLLSVIKQQCPTNTTTQINIQNITVQIWLSLQLHRSLNLLHVFVLHQLGNISGSYIYNYNPDDTKQAFIW